MKIWPLFAKNLALWLIIKNIRETLWAPPHMKIKNIYLIGPRVTEISAPKYYFKSFIFLLSKF